MADLNRFRPRPWHLILYRGPALLVADLAGLITDGAEGFYYRQTRFLSKLRLTVDGAEPTSVSANPIASDAVIAYHLAASPAGATAGPEPVREHDGGEIARHAIEIQIDGSVGGWLVQAVTVTNHGLAPAETILRWEFAADFADYSEALQGERRQEAPIAREWRAGRHGGELTFRYRHAELDHAVIIRLSGPGDFAERDGEVAWRIELPLQSPVRLRIDVMPIFCGDAVPLQPRRGPETGDERPTLAAADPLVQVAWDRAAADLASLALLDGEGDERRTPASGIPKYMALFGRDTLVAGFQAGIVNPAMLSGTLRLVSKYNAVGYDDHYDAEPGRVIHQRQQSPLALLGKNPFRHYYGDYSAPGWFPIAAAWHLAVTGDTDRFRALQEKLVATLDWMDRDGDRDGDGFYEYQTKSPLGEKNQGWKDSDQAVLYPDGRMVPNPIALVEIQGCYYAAKQSAALAFAFVGERERAERLWAEAAGLKRRFNEAFWLPEKKYFALALDPDKRPVKTVAADPGQCLAYGIIDGDKAAAVAERLMQPDLFSGWGLRTLSNRHPAFNPFAYHLGSVWPVSNAMIAFGLKRYGFTAALQRIVRAMFEASDLFEFNRLPEVFGGHRRDTAHPHPGIYPDATSPQAWSASAVLLFVQTLLGLIPAAPLGALIVDPELPEWLPSLTLRGVRIGEARVTLRFDRDKAGNTDHQVLAREGPLRVVRTPPCPPGEDRLKRAIGELLACR